MTPFELLEAKQAEVNNCRRDVPAVELKERIERLQEPARSLATIHADTVGIIGEIKPPDHALADLFDPRIWGQEYAGAGCVAVAVCTDTAAHDGDRFGCRRARKYMPLPIVRFDYIIDDYQLYESRVFQGDAVTIPEAFLADGQITHMISVCDDLKISPIIMVDDYDGAKRAVELGAKYILAVPLLWDYSASVPLDEVARMADGFPEQARLIAFVPELTRQAVEELAELGVNAVMGAPTSYDPSEAAVMIRQLNEIPRRGGD